MHVDAASDVVQGALRIAEVRPAVELDTGTAVEALGPSFGADHRCAFPYGSSGTEHRDLLIQGQRPDRENQVPRVERYPPGNGIGGTCSWADPPFDWFCGEPVSGLRSTIGIPNGRVPRYDLAGPQVPVERRHHIGAVLERNTEPVPSQQAPVAATAHEPVEIAPLVVEPRPAVHVGARDRARQCHAWIALIGHDTKPGSHRRRIDHGQSRGRGRQLEAAGHTAGRIGKLEIEILS